MYSNIAEICMQNMDNSVGRYDIVSNRMYTVRRKEYAFGIGRKKEPALYWFIFGTRKKYIPFAKISLVVTVNLVIA